ncbi:hypothetical protein OYC64_022039 [Pagothenia borchgrevinki]|uniref:Uncharacterized protein n=1 Tax=Pagothenia borchgrevinki TaxID=8213 RepID=A0ABD2G2Y0_PAGBO
MHLSDEYLTLDMALRFGGSGFYTYHVHFARQAAGRIKQFNQGTYWGALDSEFYYRIFASRASLSCPLPPGLSMLSQRSTTSNNSLTSLFITPKTSTIYHLPHPHLPSSLVPQTNAPQPTPLFQRASTGMEVQLSTRAAGCAHARSTCPHNPT